MKTKQLANVLIKVLGLSMLIHGISGVILPLLNVLLVNGGRSGSGSLNYALSSMIVPVIGICLIVKSRCLADWLFKNEDE